MTDPFSMFPDVDYLDATGLFHNPFLNDYAESLTVPLPEGLKSWEAYDQIHCNFSGGKDSWACVLLLLFGYKVPKDKLVLVHMRVDGEEEDVFFDWKETDDYLKYCAEKIGLPLVVIANQIGMKELIQKRGKWPDKARQFCTSYQKRDVYNKWVRSLEAGTYLCITGERAQESSTRAKKATFEVHATTAPTKHRWVDWFRPVHHLEIEQVWKLMDLAGIQRHPCYDYVSRCSCKFCIYLSPSELNEVRELFPLEFDQLVQMEKDMGHTMKTQKIKGTVYPMTLLEFIQKGSITKEERPCLF